MSSESSLPMIPIDRSIMLRGRKTLDQYFKSKKNLRLLRREALLISYLLETEGESPSLRLLVLTPKRSIRQAHDRKRLRRWTLEAIRTDPKWRELYRELTIANVQLTVSVMHTSPPSRFVDWISVTQIISEAGGALFAKVHSVDSNT